MDEQHEPTGVREEVGGSDAARTQTLIETPIAVCGEILPGKIDPASVARFANFGHAEAYARVLFHSRDYAVVVVREGDGTTYTLVKDDAEEAQDA